MNPFEMVVAIIIVVTIGKVIQTKLRADADHRPEQEAEAVQAQQLRQEIRGLRDRIAVLERVITENHSSVTLDREIERLRERDER